MAKPNSLKQYLDLYGTHGDALSAHAPSALNALRPQALAALADARLPRKGEEGYEQTSLEEMFAPDFGVNINRIPMQADVAAAFRCDVPNLSTLLMVSVNDMPSISPQVEQRLPKGVTFTSMSALARTDPEFLSRHYGTVAPLSRPEVALNTLLAQDGVVVHIGRGVVMEKPLQLVNLLSAAAPLMAVRRVLIVVEEDAKGSLLVCDHTRQGGIDFLASGVTEIVLERNASLSLCDIEEASERTRRCAGVYVSQQEGSSLTAVGVTLTCGTTRNDYRVSLLGPHARTNLYGMAIASANQHVDNQTEVTHSVGKCHSDQLFKYVVTDQATGSFEGLIYVAPGAAGTQAYQSNRNLVGSYGATMHTKPQLEIYCDDVKCSHGAATGQLDSEALFYMQSRGIPLEEARTMLMQAFMADVIGSVDMEGLRQRLTHLVERRFSHDHTGCTPGCHAGCAAEPIETPTP